MKNILLGWNIVLTALVIYLFTQSSGPTEELTGISDSTVVEEPTKAPMEGDVYFVNTDSLFGAFEMSNVLQEELVAEQMRMKKKYDGRLSQLEAEYNDLRERAPYMTQTQGEAAQQKLMVKQQELVKMEEDLTNKLAKKEQDMVRKIKDALTMYLKEYQEEKGYQFVLGKSEISGVLYASDEFDLTQDVLEGLNKKYEEANKVEEK